ncbi:MAG: hypothetical protein P8Y97_22595 [Candidatus Lokiarchaeota archaeon]
MEEFKRNFNFFKIIYSLRSYAIHGGNWRNYLNKTINKLNKIGVKANSYQDLKIITENKLAKIISKLIHLDIPISTFKNQIEHNSLYYIENSNLYN